MFRAILKELGNLSYGVLRPIGSGPAKLPGMDRRGPRGKMPPNFSWVVDGLLAALAYPHSSEHFMYLQDQGIQTLVSLTQHKVVPKSATAIEIIHIGMPDFTPPKIEQVNRFIQLVHVAEQKRKAIAVHCHMGRGRTGTMLACYLVKSRGIDAPSAVREIRRMRPGSIETSEQERLVYTYEKHLKNL